MSDNPVMTLSNPSRTLVPLISLGLVAAMYFPLFAMTGNDHGDGHIGYALGTSFFLFCTLWLGWSGLRAPHTALIGPDGVAIRRLLGTKQYAAEDVSQWSFARPDEPPTQTPPPGNGLLMLKLADGTKFRAEVTAEMAQRLVELLPAAKPMTRL